MQKELSLILLDRIKDAPYLDRVSGLVQTFNKTFVVDENTGRTITKRIPVTSFASFQDCEGTPQPQMEMIPNGSYKSLLYFEDGGITIPIQQQNRGVDYMSRLRLVCWLNTKLVSGQTNMLLSAQVISDIISKLTGKYFNVSPFNRIHITVAGIPGQDRAIFSKYDYDENLTQYLMPPFEYFAIDFSISYTIADVCLPPIETGLDPCSILNQIFPCTSWEPQPEEREEYEKILPEGTSILIPLSEHLINKVHSITVLNADRDEVDVYKNIADDKNVTIGSNLSFENYRVIIF